MIEDNKYCSDGGSTTDPTACVKVGDNGYIVYMEDQNQIQQKQIQQNMIK